MNTDLKEALNVTVGIIAATMVVYGTVKLIQAGEQLVRELTTKKKS